MIRNHDARLFATVGACLIFAAAVFGQTDEIQVYDASIAAPGKFNLTLHSNFTPDGRQTPAFPGSIVPDKSFNGVPEWAYGVTEWFEAGLYLPVYSISQGRGLTFDGFKVRTLFVSPNAANREFFYGINFEHSYNEKYWDTARVTSEIRPIIGWHMHPMDLIFNPIIDTAYNGFKNLDLAPEIRVAYNFSPNWAIGVEEYADLGTFGHINSLSRQSHQLFGVVDYAGKAVNVEFGVGFGLTSTSDQITLKLILSRELN